MFITVGIGNTNTAIGFINGQELSVERKPSKDLKTTGDFQGFLETVFTRRFPDIVKPEGSILSSVVPDLTVPCLNALFNFTGTKPLVIDANVKTELDFSRYGSSLGSDRIAVCVAAWDRYKAPFVVIDLGTATTFNVVDRNRAFLGGAILPGLLMNLALLNSNTAQLPLIGLEKPNHVIGRDTKECLLSGAYYGSAAMIDGLVAHMVKSLEQDMRIIMTGGNAAAVIPFITSSIIYEPDLLLQGLATIYRRNKKIHFETANTTSKTN